MLKYTTDFQQRRFEKELKDLGKRLRDASKSAAQAAQHGDLIENAEFDAAVNEEAVAGRILNQRIADMAGCVSMDTSKIRINGVGLGTSVRVMNLQDFSEATYNIVGIGPSDFESKHEIPYDAPVSRCLIGSQIGDSIELPDGTPHRIISVDRYVPEE